MAEYKFFLIPLLVLLINQIIKLVIYARKGQFNWSKIFAYGGMPSSHTALAVSLLMVMAYFEGLSSPEFAITLIVAIVIIKDASGIRMKLARQSIILNDLIKNLPDREEYKFPVLNERFGHTIMEVVVGALLSIVTTWLIIWLWSL